MGDIRTVWDNNTATGDWCFENGDLASGFDLETAVIISLFSDARASSDFTPTDGTNDLRGWWGNSYVSFPIGSYLWQLERAKISNGTTNLLQARDYCKAALQWMLDLGVASTVSVNTFWLTKDSLGIKIIITEPTQNQAKTFNYSYAWGTISALQQAQ